MESEGWMVDKVERREFNHTKDLYGAFDLLAIKSGCVKNRAIQVTSGGNVSARKHKMEALPHWKLLAETFICEIHGWKTFKTPKGPRVGCRVLVHDPETMKWVETRHEPWNMA